VVDAYVYAWNSGQLDTWNVVCDANVVRYDGIAPGYQYRGLAVLKRFISGYHTMFPDFTLLTEEAYCIGDRTILRWIVSGTHTSPWFLSATGRTFKLNRMGILRFKNCRLYEDKSESDVLYFMEQLGYTLEVQKMIAL
jgi:SnoaL-like polyketide cyclase